MGRGTIVSAQGEGLYTISLDYGESLIEQIKTRLQAVIDSYTAGITEQESLLAAHQAVENNFDVLQEAAITAFRNSTPENYNANLQALAEITKDLLRQKIQTEKYERKIAFYNLQKSNTETKLAEYTALVVTEQKSIWCVDYTPAATGDVSTVEINAEQPLSMIAPGAELNASYGLMTAREALSSEAVYYNAALLPGWQKFSPTYRVGTLTSIDRLNDTCTVSLDAAASSAQNLDINQATTLSSVPIEYMTCNSAAFTTWDRVVVKFENQDWESPKVIGFEDNPRACFPYRLFFYWDTKQQVRYSVANPEYYSAYSAGDVDDPQVAFEYPYTGVSEPYTPAITTTTWRPPEEDITTPWGNEAGTNSFDGRVNAPAGTLDAPGGGFSYSWLHCYIRVRFDVYWAQENDGDQFQSEDIDPFTVPAHPAGYVLNPLKSATEDCAFSMSTSGTGATLEPNTGFGLRNFGTRADSLEFDENTEYDISWAWGTQVAYTTAMWWPYKLGNGQHIPCPYNRVHIQDWLSNHWSAPPNEITVQNEFGGTQVYELDYYGPRPDYINPEYRTIEPLAGGFDTIAYSQWREYASGVIYKRKDL